MVRKALGSESCRLDKELAHTLDQGTRDHLWAISHDALLAMDRLPENEPRTGLILGYVQSGKTTAMTALMATAADAGYNIIIALLGTTNILLSQNARRITRALGIDTRSDYAWVAMQNPKGASASKDLAEWLTKGRYVFVPVLKNKGRIEDLTRVLSAVPSIPSARMLIVDDEADQGSLNTAVRKGAESAVYSAIDTLRVTVPNHCFLQYTATPYAPLLLDETDPLFPRFVKFLCPGRGYIGGREFFVDHKDTAVRFIPAGDEQSTARLPIEIPASLRPALWSFVIGSALMLETIPDAPPISMMVHSTHRKEVQERYHFLLGRELRSYQAAVQKANSLEDLPLIARGEYERLAGLGVPPVDDRVALARLQYVLKEIKLWLLNSATAIKNVDWNISPIHLLVGGNKLDRGFTVEGLTVTYMNRPASEQVDTIEQRARAFGYRSEFLPFCQFFASARTIKMLREIVFTEYDLRATMQDYVEDGRTIAEWSREIGLLLPGGAKPTRDAVVRELSKTSFGWYQLRRPTLSGTSIAHNWSLASEIGLFDAAPKDYGRLSFRTLTIPSCLACGRLLQRWNVDSYSPGWRGEELVKAFERAIAMQPEIDVVLMEQDAGAANSGPRKRQWSDQEGFINLFQGRDLPGPPGQPWYPGDRMIGDLATHSDRLLIQVHRITRRGHRDERLLTLALHLGDRHIVNRNYA